MKFHMPTFSNLVLASVGVLWAQLRLTHHCSNPRFKTHFKTMTVFGDSYSDTGNGYSLSNNTWPPSWYYNGRFSNGKAWPEHVSEKKHYKLQNYAFGGATSDAKLVQGYSGADTTLEVPGFIQQVQNYKNDHLHRRHGVPVLDELFVINFQGNDFEFDRSVNPHMVVDRLKAGLETLIQDAGARRILVLENLNYGLLPYYNFNATLAEIFSTTSHKQRVEYRHFEASLRTKYGPEKYVRYPSDSCGSKDKNSADQVHVAYLNMADLYKDLYRPDSLKRLGISDVVHGCVSNDFKTPCNDPGKHFYWDAFHPSSKIHFEIAKAVLSFL